MSSNAVAIVGMACRFPGASHPETLWRNLAAGVESVRRFTRDELLAEGLPAALVDHPRFVSAHGALDDIKGFDAAFFGYSPGDVALTDPQQRLFLECAYEAFENAGIVPRDGGPVTGVFAGCGVNVYFLQNVFPSLDQDDVGAVYQAVIGSEKDFLTARVNYKLGLTGPSVTIQAACATSLVAIHVACQSLLNGECDQAIAGGASIRVPQASGYLFSEGGVHSADGRCRPFDASAGGIVGGSGAGAVLLKRLSDAQRDGDPIHAVILGSAVNNDGAKKISFTAPGVDGQATVIAEARAVAGIEPTTIGYAEMHGTATALGDPIEITAVRHAMGDDWNPNWRCFIGSIKSNLGHLDSAAGVAGLMKTVLALQHASIPPSLHFVTANPALDLDSGPLRVAAVQTPWPAIEGPRRASVSSFGLGGNNSHAVLEQAPAETPRPPVPDGWRMFPLSARTDEALDAVRDRLAAFLETHPEARLDDVAWTLATGRRAFACRGYVVARSAPELITALRNGLNTLGGADAARRLGPVAEQWMAGGEPNWAAVFDTDRPKRIALPPYPFERLPHWIDPVTRQPSRPAAAAGDPFHVDIPTWTRSAGRAPESSRVRRWLVLGGTDSLTRAVIDQLRADGAEVTEAGSDPLQSNADGVLITTGFAGAVRVARALAHGGVTANQIVAVTAGAMDVIGDEPIDPQQATAFGPMLTIPMEFPGVRCRVIDVDPRQGDAVAPALVAELGGGAGEAVVALRHGQRWLPQFDASHDFNTAPIDRVIREHGVYVIVGGTGALGLALAKTIASKATVRLMLISRRGAQSAAAREAIAAITSGGSSVHVFEADGADPVAMRRVFEDIQAQHGAIHGVVHAAGLAGGGALARRTDSEMDAVMRPKMASADVLAGMPGVNEADFLVFCSSLSVYLPFPGQADYAAANTYLDAKAAALRRAGVRAVSINWDAWRDIGMALMADMPDTVRAAREKELAAIGLPPERACQAFLQILASGQGQAAVSMRPDLTPFAAPVAETTPAGSAAAGVVGGLADLWKTLLGVTEVKPADDFFDLGGHSLLATSVVFQIRQTWGCAVSVDELFVNSKFQELAALVESRTAGGDREELVL